MRIADVIKKDIKIVLRDFKALIFIFIMPIVLMSILGLALGGVFSTEGFSMGIVRVAVVDHSAADEAGLLQQRLAPYAGESLDAHAMSLYSVLDADEVRAFLRYDVVDEDEAARRLEAGEADAVITIPKGYTLGLADIFMGSGGDEEIGVHSLQSTIQFGIVGSIVQSYADTLSSISADIGILLESAVQSPQAMGSLDIPGYMQKAVDAAALPGAQIAPRGVEARRVLNSYYYYSIAITCMFILYSAGQGSTFLYTESEERTLHRLTAAGVSKRSLLFGKSFAVFCLCVLQLIGLFVFSTLAFGIDWGNTPAFLAISLCVAISVTGLGTLLMVLVYRAGNPRIGNIFQSVFVQVFALFGGSYIPLSVLPKFFSTVSLFTPNGLAIRAYTENVSGAPFSEVMPYLAGSVALGVVLFFMGVMLFPRERRA